MSHMPDEKVNVALCAIAAGFDQAHTVRFAGNGVVVEGVLSSLRNRFVAQYLLEAAMHADAENGGGIYVAFNALLNDLRRIHTQRNAPVSIAELEHRVRLLRLSGETLTPSRRDVNALVLAANQAFRNARTTH